MNFSCPKDGTKKCVFFLINKTSETECCLILLRASQSAEVMNMNQSIEMAKLAYEALDEKKGEDIKIIEIGGISSIADYFIIANGTNTSQVDALVSSVEEKLGRQGYEPKRVEGVRSASWILMDYGDVVVHVFSKEDRLFYDLERIWRDGKSVEPSELH